MPMKPTMSVPIFDGKVTVHAFGREHGCNFSFKGIDSSPLPRSTHKQIFAALASIPSRCGYYAPSPVKMNAELVSLKDPYWYQSDSRYWVRERKAFPYGTYSLHRGKNADGLSGLSERSGYVMSAADCALIVAKNGDFIVAAHAGRNSIIDMEAMKGKPPRKNESVVHAIRDTIQQRGLVLRDTKFWVGFSLSPGPHFAHAFDDARNTHNRNMVEYVARHYGLSCFKNDGQGGTLGWLDTKELIRRQLISLGASEERIELDSVCTFSDMKDDEYVWYSNVRSGENRNLIAVVVNNKLDLEYLAREQKTP
jgi:hypothetical protein